MGTVRFYSFYNLSIPKSFYNILKFNQFPFLAYFLVEILDFTYSRTHTHVIASIWLTCHQQECTYMTTTMFIIFKTLSYTNYYFILFCFLFVSSFLNYIFIYLRYSGGYSFWWENINCRL